MMLLLILLIPFITGFTLLGVRNAAAVKVVALSSAILTLFLTVSLVFFLPATRFSVSWINFLGTDFSLGYDGISSIMLLLTNLLFPFIILAGFKHEQKQVPVLYALILFTQSALIGVFLAQNAFLFYVFWELALIPVYFILLL